MKKTRLRSILVVAVQLTTGVIVEAQQYITLANTLALQIRRRTYGGPNN